VSVAEVSRARRGSVHAMFVAMRPRQWTKNLLLFAGVIFAAKLGDAERLAEALAGFVAYCAASSSAYLLNDLRDVVADRAHPLKCRRPIASGEVSPTAALWLAGGLAAVALALAAVLGPRSLALLAGFAAIQVAYTAALKHVVLIDVSAIAGLFVIRAAAGAVAVDVRISPWLLLCTALLSLFLALGKRRGELVLVASSSTPGRRVLDGYSLAVVDRLLMLVAAGTIVAYALYTLTARSSHALTVTIPFVVFGVGRYVLLLHRRGLGEEPENVLVRDVPILVTVALWTLTCAIVLARG
jgi:4-hydroxybenzoate polyprenyltransferase